MRFALENIIFRKLNSNSRFESRVISLGNTTRGSLGCLLLGLRVVSFHWGTQLEQEKELLKNGLRVVSFHWGTQLIIWGSIAKRV